MVLLFSFLSIGEVLVEENHLVLGQVHRQSEWQQSVGWSSGENCRFSTKAAEVH